MVRLDGRHKLIAEECSNMIKFNIPVYLWRAAAVAYMAALMFVSVIPRVFPGPSTSVKETAHNFFHIPAYAVLLFFIWKSVGSQFLKQAAAVAFIYGLINELLQTFIPERTGSLTDAGLNAIGIGLMFFAIRRWEDIRQNPEVRS